MYMYSCGGGKRFYYPTDTGTDQWVQRISLRLFGALVLDLKLKICECDMSLQTVESDGSRRKKEKEDRDDLRSENCSIDMIRVEEDQLVLLELGP